MPLFKSTGTGPTFDFSVSELFFGNNSFESIVHASCLKSLSVDSEEVYHLTQQLGLLAIARTLLYAVRTNTMTGSFWAMRSTFIQQQLLDEFTGSLQTELMTLSQENAEHIESNKTALDAETIEAFTIRHELETGLVYSFFGRDEEALKKMELAQKESGFVWSLDRCIRSSYQISTF